MSDHLLADWRQHALTLETEVNKVVVGQFEPVRLITTAIFARGHVLLEGDVGVGKTTLLRAFTRGIGGGYQRQGSNSKYHTIYPGFCATGNTY